jgi:hypothetical protein
LRAGACSASRPFARFDAPMMGRYALAKRGLYHEKVIWNKTCTFVRIEAMLDLNVESVL